MNWKAQIGLQEISNSVEYVNIENETKKYISILKDYIVFKQWKRVFLIKKKNIYNYEYVKV